MPHTRPISSTLLIQDEVFWLSKVGGKTVVHRVNDDPQLVAQHGYGDHLGRMWQSGAFGGAHPE